MRVLVHAASVITPPPLRHLAKRVLPGFYSKLYGLAYSDDKPAEVVIRSGPLGGRRFVCRRLCEPHYVRGDYEPEVQAVAERYIKAGMVAYDVGAHRGYFSLLFASLVGEQGRVFGFEPQPSNFELIEQTAALNPDLARRLQFIGQAVSDAAGTANLVQLEPFSSMSRLGGENDHASIEVRTTSLDNFVAEGNPPPNFIKMDIEGAETLAFRGMNQIMENTRPVLLVEIHDQPALLALNELNCKYGYVCKRLGDPRFSDEVAWIGRDQYLAIPRSTKEAPSR